MKPKRIAIHQPNFLPWLGFFHKIHSCDEFIVLDSAQYSTSDVLNRTFVRKKVGSEDRKYVRIPLRKSKLGVLITDLRVAQRATWVEDFFNSVRDVYAKAPFYKPVAAFLDEAFGEVAGWSSIADINLQLIQALCGRLNIRRPMFKASELNVEGGKQELVLNLVERCGGAVYISGTAAEAYQSKSAFRERGIELVYQRFFEYLEGHPYSVHQGPFVNGLSIVDALFNCSADQILELLEGYQIN